MIKMSEFVDRAFADNEQDKIDAVVNVILEDWKASYEKYLKASDEMEEANRKFLAHEMGEIDYTCALIEYHEACTEHFRKEILDKMFWEIYN